METGGTPCARSDSVCDIEMVPAGVHDPSGEPMCDVLDDQRGGRGARAPRGVLERVRLGMLCLHLIEAVLETEPVADLDGPTAFDGDDVDAR
jgi:hypothetical protein